MCDDNHWTARGNFEFAHRNNCAPGKRRHHSGSSPGGYRTLQCGRQIFWAGWFHCIHYDNWRWVSIYTFTFNTFKFWAFSSSLSLLPHSSGMTNFDNKWREDIDCFITRFFPNLFLTKTVIREPLKANVRTSKMCMDLLPHCSTVNKCSLVLGVQPEDMGTFMCQLEDFKRNFTHTDIQTLYVEGQGTGLL